MKFSEYKYERIKVDDIRSTINKIIDKMDNCDNYNEFKKYFDEYCELESKIDTMASLCNVRYTINTKDEFYSKENDFWDENMPIIMGEQNKFNEYILKSKYLDDLKKDIPETYFLDLEYALKSYSETITNDLQQENHLKSDYQKLIATAQIEFEGETYTLSKLASLTEDSNRELRKKAYIAYWGWFEKNEDKLDYIYDQLVKVRDRIAKKLGFENFVDLGYIRQRRYDYNKNDVANYRKQVLDYVVPVANKLYERQKKRLGVDKLECYDEKYEFVSGNPTPKYPKDELVKRAQKMYHELSDNTGKFFDFMVENELMDLESKDGKASGGYCTCFTEYNSPFIFANFNKTSHDVEVLTHEAGHAYQVYCSMNIRPVSLIWPTMESCEIHSMSMEFLTHPWMKLFFEDDCEKFYFKHVGDAVKFLPYGVLIDHFQHEVYEHPEMTPAERKGKYRELEKLYLPHKNYDDVDILERGGWWFKQLHVFLNPFYYIDYTLAQVCALQFFLRKQNNDSSVFDDYQNICNIGGKYPFKTIVKMANLKVPFDDCLKDIMSQIDEYLDNIDDSKF